MFIWRTLQFLPESFLTAVKRHSDPKLRFWIRQKLGATYESIPDEIRTISDGRRFHIGPDAAYWTIHLGLSHEPETTSFMREFVRPGDIVVDIGANFGWYTTLLAQWVAPGGHVFAFEPVPSTYQRLTEHLALNGVAAHVTATQAAVGDRRGTANIYVADQASHTTASLAQLGNGRHDSAEVPLLQLDAFMADRGCHRIDFLKCDVEGSELAVLRGCDALLTAADAPVLLVELNAETSRAFGHKLDDVWQLLIEAEYDHFFEIVGVNRLKRVKPGDHLKDQNLICAKRDAVERRLRNSGLDIQAL